MAGEEEDWNKNILQSESLRQVGVGSVALEDDQVPEYLKENQKAMVELNNSYLASDSRIEISQVPIGDGLTLCRRLH